MVNGFSDHCEYVRACGRDHYIDHDVFHEFVGRSDLFEDSSLIAAFLCGLFDLFLYYFAFLNNDLIKI